MKNRHHKIDVNSYNDMSAVLHEAILYAHERAPASTTHSSLSRNQHETNEPLIAEIRNKVNDLTIPAVLTEYYGIGNDADHRIRRIHKISKKNKAANCYELSYLIAKYLKKNNIPCEIVKLKDFDHVFVVTGRVPFTYLTDLPDTWGKNAIICDPLNKLVYLASEYNEKLKGHEYRHDFDPPNRDIPYEEMDRPIIKSIHSTLFHGHKALKIGRLRFQQFKAMFDQLKKRQAYNVFSKNIHQNVLAMEKSMAVFDKLYLKEDIKWPMHFIERSFHKFLKEIMIKLENTFLIDEVFLAIFKTHIELASEQKFKPSLAVVFENINPLSLLEIFSKLTKSELYNFLNSIDGNGKKCFEYFLAQNSSSAFKFIFDSFSLKKIIALLTYDETFIYKNAFVQAVELKNSAFTAEFCDYITENITDLSQNKSAQKKLLVLFDQVDTDEVIDPATFYYIAKTWSILLRLQQGDMLLPFKINYEDDNNILQLLLTAENINYLVLFDCMSYLPKTIFTELLLHKNEFGNSAYDLLFLTKKTFNSANFLKEFKLHIKKQPALKILLKEAELKLSTISSSPLIHVIDTEDYAMFIKILNNSEPHEIEKAADYILLYYQIQGEDLESFYFDMFDEISLYKLKHPKLFKNHKLIADNEKIENNTLAKEDKSSKSPRKNKK